MVQGAITGPVGGATNSLRSLTLRSGIIIVSDIAGGTLAEIAINDKSFGDAAFQSTFSALAGYGASKVLKRFTFSHQRSQFTRNLYKAVSGKTFSLNINEINDLKQAFLGENYRTITDRKTGALVGWISKDGNRVVRSEHVDKGTTDPHFNFEDKKAGTNAHIKVRASQPQHRRNNVFKA